ncbi:hypothetical protein CDV36_016519, partial [Fusarium kuroshium]
AKLEATDDSLGGGGLRFVEAFDDVAMPDNASEGPRVLTVITNWGRTRGIRFGNLLADPVGKECREDIGQFPKLNRASQTDDASALTAATAQTGGTPRTIYKVSLVIINANSRDYIITFAAPSSGSYFRYFDLKGIGAHI